MATPTTLPTIVLSTGLWGFTLTLMQVLVALGTSMLLGLQLNVNLLTTFVFVILTIACMSPPEFAPPSIFVSEPSGYGTRSLSSE